MLEEIHSQWGWTITSLASELALPSHWQAQAATRTIQIITKWKVATSAGAYEDCLTDADSNRGTPPPKKQLDDALTPSYGHSSVPDDISHKPTCTGPDGLLQDIRVIDLDETEGPQKQWCIEHSQDIDSFFSPVFMREGKKQAECKQVLFINKVSTLCHHMQAVHKAEYLKWATSKNFLLMLPEDTK
ncbi:hypothetical protein EDD16DRAFT_1527517 [Pisolithus croceorrhizus]|nr:hypothetical protein EDD16DRAFT_1527517 [Pisolithus croceorrhizus]